MTHFDDVIVKATYDIGCSDVGDICRETGFVRSRVVASLRRIGLLSLVTAGALGPCVVRSGS